MEIIFPWRAFLDFLNTLKAPLINQGNMRYCLPNLCQNSIYVSVNSLLPTIKPNLQKFSYFHSHFRGPLILQWLTYYSTFSPSCTIIFPFLVIFILISYFDFLKTQVILKNKLFLIPPIHFLIFLLLFLYPSIFI